MPNFVEPGMEQIENEKISAAGVLVISMPDKKILAFARRGDRSQLGLPAGKREKDQDTGKFNETIKECAEREVYGETGNQFEIDETSDLVFIDRPDQDRMRHLDAPEENHTEGGYCATYIKIIDSSLANKIQLQGAHNDPRGVPEGFALWVTPEEFVADGSSAFKEYNTKLLRTAGLI